MPLPLPPGTLIVPVVPGEDQALAGPRVTDHRFELLNHSEHYLGTLDTVTGGSVDWVARTAIHGGGTLEVSDPGVEVDWLNVRIRPVVIYSQPDSAAVFERTLGVFTAAAPTEQWTATGRSWSVELIDKLAILDRDIVTDAQGDPVTFSAAAGANVIDTVRTLIEDTGETTPAILPNAAVLPSALTWEMGTSRLRIIDDLLDAGNFASLWTDEAGQYQARPFVEPEARAPVYDVLAPLVEGDTSLMAPEWQLDQDIYEIPNRYVAITSGSGDTPAMTSVAQNLDPLSPFSYQNRGNQWITRVLTNAEAVDQDALDAIARRGLSATTSVATVITVTNAYLPDLLMGSVIWFDLGSRGTALCEVNKLTVPFDPTELCKTELLGVLVIPPPPPPPERVTSTRRTFWAVHIQQVTSTRSTAWKVLAQVTSTRHTEWAVASALAQVTSTRATSWSVLKQVTSTRHTEWEVVELLTAVTSTRQTTWATKGQITSTRHTEWAVLSSGAILSIEQLGATLTQESVTSITSDSVTVAVGDLVVVAASALGGASATGSRTTADISTTLGGSWTWHLIQSAPGVVSACATFAYWALVPSGGNGTGTFTATFGGTANDAKVSVVRFQGVNTADPVRGDAILSNTTSTSGSITVGEAPTVNDMLFGFFTSRNDTSGMTQGSGFTPLVNAFDGSTPTATQLVEYRTGVTSQAVGMSNAAATSNNGVAFIVKVLP